MKMSRDDEWGELSNFLANMIEKYSMSLNLDRFPNPMPYKEIERFRKIYKMLIMVCINQRKSMSYWH